MEKVIYVDNNATTKVDERVLQEVLPYFSEKYGNPSSMHTFGGAIGKDIEKARESVAKLLGTNSANEIIFTGSGSESANMAIKGVLFGTPRKHLITTKVEHACVMNTYKWLEKRGYSVTYIDVNSEGELDLEQLKNSIKEDTALVSIMWANNETGVIFPVAEVAEIVKSKNPETMVFVDAVQAAGKIPMDLKSTKIDMLSISGHKLHAQKGIGALYVKSGVLINPLIIGGHQERGKRAGTEDVIGIVGLGKACELAIEYLEDEATRIKALRDKLETGILERIYNSRVNGARANRVPNTTNISFEYIEGELILLHLSDIGICASSGSACTSGSLEPSHVLRAMGIPLTGMHGSIRFSLSRFNTEEDIDYILEKLPQIIFKINGFSPYQKELEELKRMREAQI